MTPESATLAVSSAGASPASQKGGPSFWTSDEARYAATVPAVKFVGAFYTAGVTETAREEIEG